MLSLSGRKILLSFHIMLISIWVGIIVAILLLQFLKYSTFSEDQIFVIDKSIFLLFDVIIMNVSIAVAISGLLFSMFTNWGFVKFYWIISKWIILIILAGIIMFLISPTVNGMAAFSDVFGEKVRDNTQYVEFEWLTNLYIGIQLLLLIFVIFISVLKPWGQRKLKRSINRKVVISIGIILGIVLGVSAVLQYAQLNYYRNILINSVNLDAISDGYYIGKVKFGFEYEVGVSIENHTIIDIKFLKNRESHYAKLSEGIKHKIIREQKINIDAVTGATTTSKIFLKAIEKALTQNQE